ncbi:hypothetical protein Cgig2_004466 [Carnegiea gigantea]|uniref:Uncharacterized protein n=1 Tax=Carnegiea gigantea TaxID=171969 RepID=A0A9Q1QIV2_9CARY|nr:hypothetical protein Cgig2_004466 [Carnegiea gigantea]
MFSIREHVDDGPSLCRCDYFSMGCCVRSICSANCSNWTRAQDAYLNGIEYPLGSVGRRRFMVPYCLEYRDANTQWFCSQANLRRSRNTITLLVDDNDERHSGDNEISDIIVHYFGDLFSSSFDIDMYDVIGDVPWHVSQDMNDVLCAPYTIAERACHRILPTTLGISGRVPNLSMKCSVCGYMEQSNVHDVLEHPVIVLICEGSSVKHYLWGSHFCALRDYIEQAIWKLNYNHLGELITMMWECWNARNQCMFKRADNNVSLLGARAISVRMYKVLMITNPSVVVVVVVVLNRLYQQGLTAVFQYIKTA